MSAPEGKTGVPREPGHFRFPERTSDLNAHGAVHPMRVVGSYGPLHAGPPRGPVGPISIGRGLFSNPTAIRDLPDVVIRSLPSRFATYPSSINRALCSAGIIAGGSSTAHVLPTTRREANSSGVRGSDSHAIIRLCPLTCFGTWSNLLRWANKPDLSASWPNSRNGCFELERESKWRIGPYRAKDLPT
jgi:hypothetical protein